jgi:predicted ATPase/class 3 adenylate cyclase
MASEARKTVTVFFCDVTGSTDMGERLDPESQRRVMTRYFETVSEALQRHGGSVEKFIGDAVMAVFGIPQLHEDDALRAVRAAAEARDGIATLNEELERDRGVRIQVRMGVNTGEVVAGDPTTGQNLVTGDAVNVAARLEQAAAPGEILIGDETHRLVRDAISAEPVEPLELKGKSEPVPAFRVLDAPADTPAFIRRLDAPFVGRELQLTLLQHEFERVVEERSCRLVTLIGAAGIGKSRLVLELTQSMRKRAKTLSGHCLPYGEGITYWPLVEIVKQLGGGGDARSTTTALFIPSEEALLIAERIAGAVGQTESSGSNEEIFWAVRKLLETLAKGRPLIIVLDDIHWAEQTFLDLIEYLLGFSTDAPILLLCVARPELLDARPSWSTPRPNTNTIVLEPLSGAESEQLVGENIPPEERERILRAAEGNPLFVEQMLALRAENGGDSAAIPPTIQALIAARIDRLEPDELAVIERGSVEGRIFHRSAVAELSPESLRDRASAHLFTLVRKELIRPGRAEFSGDDAFSFGHILIRDAAYSAMPKELRAELHERFADWLERQAGDRIREYEEILGFHLEQAYRHRADLGPIDAEAERIGLRAAEHLAAAGNRAYIRGDCRAAVTLLDRSVLLLSRQSAQRVTLLTQLGSALADAGDLARADTVLGAAVTLARELGDRRLEWHARIEQLDLHSMTQPEGWTEIAPREAQEALEVFLDAGDEAGLASAKGLAGMGNWMHCRFADAVGLYEEAAEHARRAGADRERGEILMHIAAGAIQGPMPVTDATLRLEQILDEVRPNLEVFAGVKSGLALLYAMARRFEEARTLIAEAKTMLAELDASLFVTYAVIQMEAEIEAYAGNHEEARAILRQSTDALVEIGEKSYASTALAYLAGFEYELGRDEEALRLCEQSLQSGSSDDLATQILARSVRAKVLARQSRIADAEQSAGDAAAFSQQTDHLSMQGQAWLALGIVLRAGGRADEAVEAVRQGLAVIEQKGDLVKADKARAFLAELVPA